MSHFPKPEALRPRPAVLFQANGEVTALALFVPPLVLQGRCQLVSWADGVDTTYPAAGAQRSISKPELLFPSQQSGCLQ